MQRLNRPVWKTLSRAVSNGVFREVSLGRHTISIHALPIYTQSLCSSVMFSHISVLSLSLSPCACTAMSVPLTHTQSGFREAYQVSVSHKVDGL